MVYITTMLIQQTEECYDIIIDGQVVASLEHDNYEIIEKLCNLYETSIYFDDPIPEPQT